MTQHIKVTGAATLQTTACLAACSHSLHVLLDITVTDTQSAALQRQESCALERKEGRKEGRRRGNTKSPVEMGDKERQRGQTTVETKDIREDRQQRTLERTDNRGQWRGQTTVETREHWPCFHFLFSISLLSHLTQKK
ncbi:hypothetical protein ACOMHN_003354 [Nucella lapillus]